MPQIDVELEDVPMNGIVLHEVCATECMEHREKKKTCHGVLDVAGAMTVNVFVIYSTSKSVYFTDSPFHKFLASAFRSGTTISMKIFTNQNRIRDRNLAMKYIDMKANTY